MPFVAGGTGKSSLANILCNRGTPTQAVHGVKLGGSQFPTRSPLSTRHATSGIEIRVSATLGCLERPYYVRGKKRGFFLQLMRPLSSHVYHLGQGCDLLVAEVS